MQCRDEGLNGFYKSLVPLWMRQIPYTMMKFACFEKTVELLYKYKNHCHSYLELWTFIQYCYLIGMLYLSPEISALSQSSLWSPLRRVTLPVSFVLSCLTLLIRSYLR